MTQTFVIFLRNFHLLYCSDWQKLIIASLIADRTWSESDSSNPFVFGILATVQTLFHTTFERVGAKNFDELVPAAFLWVCFNYYYLQ